eukprot:gene526-1179_t
MNIILLCNLLLWLSSASKANGGHRGENRTRLRIGGFVPGIQRHDYFGYLTAIEMAMHWVNSNRILPDNHTITLDAEETMGFPAHAIYGLAKFLRQPAKVAFVGPAFTRALRPIALALQHYSVLQISFASTASFFNNLLRYPFLFRTVPTTELFNFARVAFVDKFKWKRFALLYDRNDESLALTSSLLLKALAKRGYTVVAAVGVGAHDDNHEKVLQRLKALNVRIIFGDFLSAVARKIFCAAYKTGVYGKKYVWIISGNIRERLKMEDFRVSCRAKDVVTASHLAFTIGQLNYVIGNETTITGETAPELFKRYQQTSRKLGRRHRTYGGYAFDTIIAIALVIRNTASSIDWVNMSYNNFTAAEIAKSALRKVKFQGMTGLVEFNGQSERKVGIAIQQVINGKEQLFAIFKNRSQKIEHVEGKSSFVWHDNKVTLDGERRIQKTQEITLGLSLPLVVLTAIGIIACLGILFILIKYRDFHAIKKCSPKLSILILIGCFFCYLTVFLLAMELLISKHQYKARTWKARQWLMVIGFTLSFGAMFAKTYRVYRIMTNKALRKELPMISYSRMFTMIGIFLLIDIVYMSAWEIFDPLTRRVFWLKPTVIPEKDLEIETYIFLYDCKYLGWWTTGLFVYKGCLLMFGLFLAYETRNIYNELSDSRKITFTVYNVGVFSIIGAAVPILLKKSQQEIIDGFVGCFIILCTTIAISVIFLPKIIELYRGCKDSKDEDEAEQKIKAPERLMQSN